MTADELRRNLTRLMLSQAALARLIGVSANAVNYWVSGARPIPGPVAALVRLLLQLHARGTRWRELLEAPDFR